MSFQEIGKSIARLRIEINIVKKKSVRITKQVIDV